MTIFIKSANVKLIMLNGERNKADFPIFNNYSQRWGANLVFLDSAASSQTPQCVIDAMNTYYFQYRSNVHRSPYGLGDEATRAYEHARDSVAKFIGSEKWEVIFTSGSTMGSNMLIAMLEEYLSIGSGTEVLSTVAEHHSTLLPLQELCKRTGAILRLAPLRGADLDYDFILKNITLKTKVVALSISSNVLGTIFDIKPIINRAKEVGALTIIDATTAIGHIPLSVADLGCDFLFFSGHKTLGPTGIGVLYGKEDLLSDLKPVFFGGGMIESVSEQTAEYTDIPTRFEAGTANIAGAIGLDFALQYIETIGIDNIAHHSQNLLQYALKSLNKIQGLRIVSEQRVIHNSGIISFILENHHSHDVARFLDTKHVAIRAGHHCAIPLSNTLGVKSICRASFYLYNTQEDIDVLIRSIINFKKVARE